MGSYGVPTHGRKSMSNWGYFTLLVRFVTFHLSFVVLGPPCRYLPPELFCNPLDSLAESCRSLDLLFVLILHPWKINGSYPWEFTDLPPNHHIQSSSCESSPGVYSLPAGHIMERWKGMGRHQGPRKNDKKSWFTNRWPAEDVLCVCVFQCIFGIS